MKRSDSNTGSYAKRLLSLYTAAISDVLDQVDVTENTMVGGIQPIYNEAKVAGPAFTVRAEFYPKYSKDDNLQPLVDMMETVRANEVVVVSTAGKMNAAVWGELMSYGARNKGAVGMVTDGAVRDVNLMLNMNPRFPVFAAGRSAADALGRCRISEHGKSIVCGSLKVRQGDYIFADNDGVVVIPRAKLEKVLDLAEEKVRVESEFRASIRKGMTISQAYAKYKTM